MCVILPNEKYFGISAILLMVASVQNKSIAMKIFLLVLLFKLGSASDAWFPHDILQFIIKFVLDFCERCVIFSSMEECLPIFDAMCKVLSLAQKFLIG